MTGFYVAIFSHRFDTSASYGDPIDESHFSSNSEPKSKSLELSAPMEAGPPLLLGGTVPHSMIKRVMSSLLTGVEFSTAERSHKGTQVIETAIEGLCDGLGRMGSEPPAKDGRTSDVKIPVTATGSADSHIYHAHIYASLSISNPPLDPKASDNAETAISGTNPPVNVLGVRRKKKREQ